MVKPVLATMLAASALAMVCCLSAVLVPLGAVTVPLVMVRGLVGSGIVTLVMVIDALLLVAPMAMVPKAATPPLAVE
ncbi:hypothetical protein D3C72_2005150 [compost metagenome]